MGTQPAVPSANLDDSSTKEYSLVIDGVIEITTDVEPKPFFDGLLDVILAYVEQHESTAGLSMSYKG